MSVPARRLPSISLRPQSEAPSTGKPAAQRLKLLSYNIQGRIAALIGGFDIVGLQEVDGGSLRSGFINQTEYLAIEGRFPYWNDQTNRNLGKFAQHSPGVLSRLCPAEVIEVKLPGMIPGRGALTGRS